MLKRKKYEASSQNLELLRIYGLQETLQDSDTSHLRKKKKQLKPFERQMATFFETKN